MNKLFDLLDKYNPFIVVLKLRTNGDLFVKMPEKKSEKLINLEDIGIDIKDRELLEKFRGRLNSMGYEVVLR